MSMSSVPGFMSINAMSEAAPPPGARAPPRLRHELYRLQLAHQPGANSGREPVQDGVANRVGLPPVLGSHGVVRSYFALDTMTRQRALRTQDYLRKKRS